MGVSVSDVQPELALAHVPDHCCSYRDPQLALGSLPLVYVTWKSRGHAGRQTKPVELKGCNKQRVSEGPEGDFPDEVDLLLMRMEITGRSEIRRTPSCFCPCTTFARHTTTAKLTEAPGEVVSTTIPDIRASAS